MKNIYLIVTLILLGLSNLEAQNPFVGTWEYQEGNDIFRVQIYMNDDDLRGHYWKLTENNGMEIITAKSNKDVGHGLTLGPVIYGDNNATTFFGGIEDNTVETQYELLGSLSGTLRMEIISSNPTTASWKIKGNNGSRLDIDNRVFSIPTDIIMTKVE